MKTRATYDSALSAYLMSTENNCDLTLSLTAPSLMYTRLDKTVYCFNFDNF